jgi:hypothetical protein
VATTLVSNLATGQSFTYHLEPEVAVRNAYMQNPRRQANGVVVIDVDVRAYPEAAEVVVVSDTGLMASAGNWTAWLDAPVMPW